MAPGRPCQRVPGSAVDSPVALDVDPLEPEVADHGIHGLELDARTEKSSTDQARVLRGALDHVYPTLD